MSRSLLIALLLFGTSLSVARGELDPDPGGESCGRSAWFEEEGGVIVPVDVPGIGCRGAVPVDQLGWFGEYVRRVPRHLAAEMALDLSSLSLPPAGAVTVLTVADATSYDTILAPPPGEFVIRLIVFRADGGAGRPDLRLALDWNGAEPISTIDLAPLPEQEVRLRLRYQRAVRGDRSTGEVSVFLNGVKRIGIGEFDSAGAFDEGTALGELDPAALVRMGNLGFSGTSGGGRMLFDPARVEIGWGLP